MKAYKLFRKLPNNKLGPISTWNELVYDPKYIVTPADGCGPFTAFKSIDHLCLFYNLIAPTLSNKEQSNIVAYEVDIRKSKKTVLYFTEYGSKTSWTIGQCPPGTVICSEFQIVAPGNPIVMTNPIVFQDRADMKYVVDRYIKYDYKIHIEAFGQWVPISLSSADKILYDHSNSAVLRLVVNSHGYVSGYFEENALTST